MCSEFWTKGFYVHAIGKYKDENTIQNYVKFQEKEEEYKKIHSQQLSMF
jgi:putative transposase